MYDVLEALDEGPCVDDIDCVTDSLLHPGLVLLSLFHRGEARAAFPGSGEGLNQSGTDRFSRDLRTRVWCGVSGT